MKPPFNLRKLIIFLTVILLIASRREPVLGQSFLVLKNFGDPTTGPDGKNPNGNLILSSNTLYGTTVYGGPQGLGNVYSVNIDGTGYTVLYTFTGGDGANPVAGLVLSGNTLYGLTYQGGSLNWGTIFAINTDGSGFSVLHQFLCFYNYKVDGANCLGPLVLVGSTLYGAASWGGTPHGSNPLIFKINTDGSGYTVLHVFNTISPPSGGVVSDGTTLYGMQDGALFSIGMDGTGFKTLFGFSANSALLLSGGAVYGTLSVQSRAVAKSNLDGTGNGFLARIAYAAAGSIPDPSGSLHLVGNTLYGMVDIGGDANLGAVYQVNTDGSQFSILKSFTGPDGANPYRAGVVAGGNTLYGTTQNGGAFGAGVLFSLRVPPTVFISSSDGAPQIAWTATQGLTYQLQLETSLIQSNWVNFGPPFLATNTTMSVPLTAQSAPSGFLRVLEQQ